MIQPQTTLSAQQISEEKKIPEHTIGERMSLGRPHRTEGTKIDDFVCSRKACGCIFFVQWWTRTQAGLNK